jgi:hypothetical protein
MHSLRFKFILEFLALAPSPSNLLKRRQASILLSFVCGILSIQLSNSLLHLCTVVLEKVNALSMHHGLEAGQKIVQTEYEMKEGRKADFVVFDATSQALALVVTAEDDPVARSCRKFFPVISLCWSWIVSREKKAAREIGGGEGLSWTSKAGTARGSQETR